MDTQPVSAAPAIHAAGEQLGTLEMRNWLRTIDAVDARVETAVSAGRFAIEAEERFLVSDTFDDGAELVAIVRGWRGTRIASAVARRVEAAPGPLSVDQEVRVRLMRPLDQPGRSAGRTRPERGR